MALYEIDASKIAPPTHSLIESIIKETASPHIRVEWILLFDEYNKAHPKAPKHMHCRPCYGLVYRWFQEERKNQKK